MKDVVNVAKEGKMVIQIVLWGWCPACSTDTSCFLVLPTWALAISFSSLWKPVIKPHPYCPLCPLGMLWYWTGYVTECVQWPKAKSLFQNTALPLSLLHSPKPTGKRRELQYKCNVVIQITLIPALRGVKLQKRLLHSLMEEFCISYGPTVVAWEPAGSSAKYG